MITLPKASDLLSISDVKKLVGLSESAIYRGVGSKTFPKPVKFGPKMNRWIKAEIEQWFTDRIAERDVA
ncbi:AlpA family phage regulatory protein [Mesorhizobium sp. M1273]|uniref:helix-turn-helix transcriptional regulator n=1 Tax=Mesorhizobium sp. M1273 TaxID=2957075 RepID=UPI003339CB28